MESPVQPNIQDEKTILQQYPNAKILRVSADKYPQLAAQLQSQGYRLGKTRLASNEAISPTTIDAQPSEPSATSVSGDCGDSNQEVDDGSVHVMLDVSSDMLGSSGDSGDGAAVIYVIVGTVLVFVWTLYVFKYLYDVATGFAPCDPWREFTATSSRISTSRFERADFYGLKYLAGFRDGITKVGFSIELGEADIFLPQLINRRLQGTYWMLGPLLRWRISPGNNPHYFDMSFVGGSTNHNETGLIAKATLGMQFGLSDKMHLGVNWGAMNIDIKESQGLFNAGRKYYYQLGTNFGIRF
ncbi:MAG: hypothetical protein KAJ19_02005 [Gammaproteobacteria bacterium]|nr:hypothetical protein [Gammaproteobacteria bacterium]